MYVYSFKIFVDLATPNVLVKSIYNISCAPPSEEKVGSKKQFEGKQSQFP